MLFKFDLRRFNPQVVHLYVFEVLIEPCAVSVILWALKRSYLIIHSQIQSGWGYIQRKTCGTHHSKIFF